MADGARSSARAAGAANLDGISSSITSGSSLAGAKPPCPTSGSGAVRTTSLLPNARSAPGSSSASVKRPPRRGPQPDSGAAPLALPSIALRRRAAHRRLRGRELRDRHAERRAGHVVQPDPVAELHARRVAAVLAADAQLELGPGLPALLRGDLHQRAHALLVQRHERVLRQDLL